MTPRDGRPWLPVALLLLQVPGCWCLSGPTSVTGTVGGSLSVQCQYEEKFREMAKYWCKSPCVWSTVKTKEADLEESNGRVSIRDHPANLTFTVTLENLTEGDAGTYWCGIVTSWLPGYFLDPTFLVVVSVTPVPSSVRPTRTPGLHRILPAPTWSTMTPKESPNPSQYPGDTWPVRGHFLETCRIWGAITQVSTEIGLQRQGKQVQVFCNRDPQDPAQVSQVLWGPLGSLFHSPFTPGPCQGVIPLKTRPLRERRGCFSIQGPRSVRGLEGGLVSVQCNYTADWETYEKWWCRGADWTSCQILVQTNGSEQVMKRDRVSIRDNQSHLLFTVTMEDVRQDDTDTYWCGISRHGPDLGTSIKVTIDPVGMILSTWVSPLSRTTTSGRAGAPSDSYIRHHYLLLVFLKVPILLALVGAVLWLKGPQQRPSIYMNLSSDLVRDTAP